jgi:hypothetical protein
MAKLMYTVKLDHAETSLDHVKRKLDLTDDEVDANFGVVNLDPRENLYAILVDDKAVQKLDETEGAEGPFANPRIETAGPPKP